MPDIDGSPILSFVKTHPEVSVSMIIQPLLSRNYVLIVMTKGIDRMQYALDPDYPLGLLLNEMLGGLDELGTRRKGTDIPWR